MDANIQDAGSLKSEPDVETQKCRLEDFALKRKFASLSSKLDRVHRQVKMRLHQKKFTWVPSPSLSKDETQQLVAQHRARIRDFIQRSCNKLLQDTLLPRFQEVFGSPVDVERFPQYPIVVKNPMDFGTMRTKLQDEQYSDLQEFVDDAMLVLDNARAFNPPGTDVHVMANCLEDDLVKVLKDTVIKNREAVDCGTLKDIEQKRCESMARVVFQLQKHIDSDIEVAKGMLMDVQREAADMSRWASDVCSWRSDVEADPETLYRQVLQLPEPLQRLLGQLRPKDSQKLGPLRATDFENASFVLHHTARNIVTQYKLECQDRQSKKLVMLASDLQPHSPELQGLQAADQPHAAPPEDANNVPTSALRTASQLLSGAALHSADALDDTPTGVLQRSVSNANVSGGGRRLARIKTRGANSASAVSTPATLHDCGTSAFDRQTPREASQSRCQDTWVCCRSLAREVGFAWPGFPDGSGCREPHIDIEGIRVKSARAYTCARAISDRMCTTYTAANSNTEWLPLVNSANSALLDSVLAANVSCAAHATGPSVILAGHEHGKLQVHRRIPDPIAQARLSMGAGTNVEAASSVSLKAAEKGTKALKKAAVEGKETRARAQEKLRVNAEAPPPAPGQAVQSSPRKQRPENLSQVAIRVFSLPNTETDAVHIARRASHLGRSTGVAELPHRTTQDLLFAPSRQKALPLVAELFNPTPLAQSWSQTANHTMRPEPVPKRACLDIPEQDLDVDSPDEAAMDTIIPDSAVPPSSIPLMTPVVAERVEKR